MTCETISLVASSSREMGARRETSELRLFRHPPDRKALLSMIRQVGRIFVSAVIDGDFFFFIVVVVVFKLHLVVAAVSCTTWPLWSQMIKYFLGNHAGPGSLPNLVAPGTGSLSGAMGLRKGPPALIWARALMIVTFFSASDTVIEICSLAPLVLQAVAPPVTTDGVARVTCRTRAWPSVFLFPASASCRIHDDSKGSLGVSAIVAHFPAFAGTLNAWWRFFFPTRA